MGKVCVCIFHKEDARSVEQRLKVAVNRYQQECRQESVLSSRDDMGLIHVRMDAVCSERVAGDDAEPIDQGINNIGQIDIDCVAGILRVQRTEKGKPYFSNCPQIQFSISHSGDYWVCAVAGEAIGIDLQKYTTARNETKENAAVRLQKMAGRFFHSTEVKFVELDSYWNFFAVWAAKEAYVKYTGQGIDRRFSEYCVIPGEESWQKVFAEWKSEQITAGKDRAQPVRVSEMPAALCWQAMEVHFRENIYPEGYALCVCTESLSDCKVIVCDDI